MNTEWISSSIVLPHEGESVEFVLQDREAIIGGSFANLTFQSRWTGYPPNRVQTWRSASISAVVRDP
ncbi:MAG: hypothetical protein ABIR62_13375 [Dokdonella sp.]|uniref:hypothetical protein n=1 Tax=Dokdonella sp. TaxID=2291710 RepID=UPI003266615F